MAVTRSQRRFVLIVLLLACLPLMAAILPEERFDLLYHHYQGGGVEITGPSLKARKTITENSSMSAHYYVDSITSASIDVVTQASPYTEERTEYGLNADYLNGKNILSLGYTTSSENDYHADTVSLGFSQDFFGDLTNLSMSFSRGWDRVSRSTDNIFDETIERRNYRLGLTQILTKNTIISLAFDVTTDEGYLNNPYRSFRYLTDDKSATLLSKEIYPGTRTSSAIALRALYYLPYRAAIGAEYRQFVDTWDIKASHWQLLYRHPTKSGWLYEIKYRQYQQTQANFYSDLFDSQNEQEYMARDKELSTFNSQVLGVSVSYGFNTKGLSWLDRGSVNLAWDHMRFDYENFRDPRSGAAPGQEPLYGFSANVIQLYLSLWY